MTNYELKKGDCLEVLASIPDDSIDLVLADPPYGTMKGISLGNFHGASWDNKINTQSLFQQLLRVCRHNARVVLFCQEPYTSELVSNADSYMLFCQRAVWMKNSFGNALSCKNSLVNMFEDICIFRTSFFPTASAIKGNEEIAEAIYRFGFNKAADILFERGNYSNLNSARRSLSRRIDKGNRTRGDFFNQTIFTILDSEIHFPYGFEEYSRRKNLITKRTRTTFNLKGSHKTKIFSYPKDREHFHPTQKPVSLLEDLISTYSNQGDTVLDFSMGSGSTGVAAINLLRDFIGIEKEPEYFTIAEKRIAAASREISSKGHVGAVRSPGVP